MPANTPNRGYTYATSGDANDLALISQRLAEQIDTDVQGVAGGAPFVAYTPTLANLTLGNGSVVGAYWRSGGFCYAHGRVTFGSTTSVSATAHFGLPLAADGVSNSVAQPLGSMMLYDTSSGAMRLWQARISGASTIIVAGPSGETVNSGTAPWTWASGDTIAWSVMYRVS